MSLIQEALEKAGNPQAEAGPRKGNLKTLRPPVRHQPQGPRQQAAAPQAAANLHPVTSQEMVPAVKGPGFRFIMNRAVGVYLLVAGLVVSYLLGAHFAKAWIKPNAAMESNFLFPFQEASPESIFNVTGITNADGEWMALVNDQLVYVGDILKEKAVVKDIRAKSVDLDYQGEIIRLNL